jgi:hypothetical protein
VDVWGCVVGGGLRPQHGSQLGPALEAALAGRASRHVVLHAAGLRRGQCAIAPRVKVGRWQGTPHVGFPPLAPMVRLGRPLRGKPAPGTL